MCVRMCVYIFMCVCVCVYISMRGIHLRVASETLRLLLQLPPCCDVCEIEFNVLQCAAICYSVLQCVAVSCNVV